jgi:hypothetical protein
MIVQGTQTDDISPAIKNDCGGPTYLTPEIIQSCEGEPASATDTDNEESATDAGNEQWDDQSSSEQF